MTNPAASNEQTTQAESPFRILSLDGGGTKGLYTLGFLAHVEKALPKRSFEDGRSFWCQHFDLIYGTSTGAIIGVLLALGMTAEKVLDVYKDLLPEIMRNKNSTKRSKALRVFADELLRDRHVSDFKTRLGIVATRRDYDRPMVFKSDSSLAHGRAGSFTPFFGCSIVDAVMCSCAAIPYFEPIRLPFSTGATVEVIDGGFVANNPTLYAVTDATFALKREVGDLRVLNVGTGQYPAPKPGMIEELLRDTWPIRLINTMFDANSNAMHHILGVTYPTLQIERVSDVFSAPETNLVEDDSKVLEQLRSLGHESLNRERELDLRRLLA